MVKIIQIYFGESKKFHLATSFTIYDKFNSPMHPCTHIWGFCIISWKDLPLFQINTSLLATKDKKAMRKNEEVNTILVIIIFQAIIYSLFVRVQLNINYGWYDKSNKSC